jgi:hypothetical protein
LTAPFSGPERAEQRRLYADASRDDLGKRRAARGDRDGFRGRRVGLHDLAISSLVDAKYGREVHEAFSLKAHVMVGTKTNVVTAVEVTHGREHDGQHFRPLLANTAKRFTLKRVSADKAYAQRASSSRLKAWERNRQSPSRRTRPERRRIGLVARRFGSWRSISTAIAARSSSRTTTSGRMSRRSSP